MTAHDLHVEVLPDFATMQGVHVHRLLRDLAPAFERSLRETLGARVAESTTGYGQAERGLLARPVGFVWTRDFYRCSWARPKATWPLRTLSVNPTRGNISGSSWSFDPPAEPDHEFYRTPGDSGRRVPGRPSRCRC